MSESLKNQHDGKIWPTTALAIVAWSIFAFAIAAYYQHLAPAWAVVVLCTLANYLAFTPLHAAAHGNLESGKQGPRTVLFGYACGLTFMAPYRLFRGIHLTHHAYTNHPSKDPDYWVRGSNPLTVLFKCLSIYPTYLFSYLTKVKRPRKEKLIETTLVFVYWLVVFALFHSNMEALLVIVVLPTWLATALQAFVFDWVPHHPHQSRHPSQHTRNLPHKALKVLMICHNWHAVHHRDPRLPFFRYEEASAWLTNSKLSKHGESVDERIKDVAG